MTSERAGASAAQTPPGRPATEAEHLLDRAVEMTFPASDPISIEHAFAVAQRAELRALGAPRPERAGADRA